MLRDLDDADQNQRLREPPILATPRFLTPRGLLAGPFRGHPGLVFPGMAVVFHCSHCAYGLRPIDVVAATRESCSALVGISEPGRTLYLRALVGLLLLTLSSVRCK
jgi:hypothetical protein